ncbi:MAG: O-antigen ligase family protein [Deltaproteobacteria bacterium]|nr:O-antigen ligase family protein [Deltaproteobacteria bacterium]
MPPQLALLITIILILYLFWVDRKKIEGVSRAIWIPLIWMFFSASRYVSQWLNLGAPTDTVDIYLEGNPVNAASFFILIAAGIIVLLRRRLNWVEIFTKNPWICLFFLFGAISFFWSDYPFVSFKRWIKTLGNVIMVLVILTEGRPYEAIGVIFRRLAFICLPLSVLFIKYYPELGRDYHATGTQMFTGVALQKNGLGQICLLFGIYFSWHILLSRWKKFDTFDGAKSRFLNRVKKRRSVSTLSILWTPVLSEVEGSDRRVEWVDLERLHYSIYLIILPMIIWLFYMSNSATSLVCMVVAVCLFLVGRMPSMALKPRRILAFGIVCIALFGVLELFFDATATVINLLGRDPTLTTRVPKWEVLLSMVRDPVFGFGWESFWLGERQQIIYEKIGLRGNAHNGYLEMYLNLGFIGIFILVGWILSGLIKIARHLVIDYPAAMLRLCFIVVFALYNWTEASFHGVSNMGILLLLGSMDIPQKHKLAQNDIGNRHQQIK